MRIRRSVAFALFLLVPAAIYADVIVLSDGRVFGVEGPIRVQGDHVHFKMLNTGQEVKFRRFEVDINKTNSLNQVLDSDIHGLPRLRRIEAIEAQRSRQVSRSVPYEEERPEPAEEEIREMSKTRVPVRYPSGDYPLAVQPDRTSVNPIGEDQAEQMYDTGRQPSARSITDYADYRESREATERREVERDERQAEQDARRAEREAEESARKAEREQKRAEREAERAAAAAEREAEEEADRIAREKERIAREEERKAAKSERFLTKIAEVDAEIDSAKAELKRLTDLQEEAEQQFEGERLPSVDREIDRLLRDIEDLENKRARYQERLDSIEAE